MAIDIREMTGSSFLLHEGTQGAPRDRPASSDNDVVEVLHRILGYDPEEEAVLAAGYLAMAKDSAEWAESTFAAQVETLPEE